MVGECRLCRNPKPLRRSHILPSWAFRRVFQLGDGKQSFMVENGTRRRSNNQDREHLLCSDCEQRFGRWEDHVSRLALQPDGSSPAFNAAKLLGHRIPGPGKETVADGTALGEETALFATSVVWRAAVCAEPSIDLGPFLEEFRSYVYGLAPGLPNARLIVNVVDPKGAPQAGEFASYPASLPRHRLERWRQYKRQQFIVPGLLFTFWVGRAYSPEADALCYMRSKRVWVTDGNQYSDFMRRAFHTAKPVGRAKG